MGKGAITPPLWVITENGGGIREMIALGIISQEAIDDYMERLFFADARLRGDPMPDRCACGHLDRVHKEMGCQSCPPGQCKEFRW